MRSGANLIEVLVASAILAAVFLPLFGLFRGGVRTTKYTEDRLRALTIAQEQIQTIQHAVSINRKSLDLVVRAHMLDAPTTIPGATGSFSNYVVDSRYRVTTEVDPDYVVAFEDLEAFVTHASVRVDWNLGKEERYLVLETLLDRTYE